MHIEYQVLRRLNSRYESLISLKRRNVLTRKMRNSASTAQLKPADMAILDKKESQSSSLFPCVVVHLGPNPIGDCAGSKCLQLVQSPRKPDVEQSKPSWCVCVCVCVCARVCMILHPTLSSMSTAQPNMKAHKSAPAA